MSIRGDFQTFIDRVPVGVCRLDRALQHVFINYRFAEFVGIDRHGDGFSTVQEANLPRELREPLLAAARRVIDTGHHVETEFRLHTRRGVRVIRMRLEPEKDEAGTVVYVAAAGFDMTEPRRLESALRESEARFKNFMDHTPTIAWIKDEGGRYLFANPYYESHFGYTGEQWKGRTDFDLWPEEFARRCRNDELEVLKSGKPKESIGPAPDRAGNIRQWHLIRFPFHDASGARFIGGIATDVTERRQVEEKVRLESVMDDLTGLYNRRGFLERSEQEYLRAVGSGSPCVMFYVDLDGLKAINDELGHDAGDSVLIAVSEILRVTFRNSDILGRLGGDEFAVLAVNCDEGDLLYERLLANVDDHNRTLRPRYELSLSIGHVAIGAGDVVSLEEALVKADEKMYAVKRGRQA